ncbi:glycosyltransferase family 87 protein [Burkholderia sp. BCC1047]|uniref:glycosyltransferase family 87 protein n=1 Tax=Burkholderia sp. BCC1047 TaxID=2676299 RepID=UPI001588860C|nr:glycosyltransferase family 87 protein [Burkholderia sp. BCC1047]
MTHTATDHAPPDRQGWLSRERLVLYSAAILVFQLVLLGIWAFSYWALHLPGVPPPGIDFRVFWSASFVSLYSGPLAAFDLHQMFEAEARLLPDFPPAQIFAPWVYPPTFQLLVYPLALLPYAASYGLFVSIGIASALAACTLAMKDRPLPWITLVAFPGIWVVTICGQNSLLTLAFAAGALGWLERRPVVAGVCAGMLVIKPQLALLFPLLFLCGGHFRALGAMAVTAALFCAISALVLGVPLWLRFFDTLSWFSQLILVNNAGGIWSAMPTPFAMSRRLGASLPSAFAVQAAIAIPAVIATAGLWARKKHADLCAAAAIVATLLTQPYLIYYDLAWLLLAIIYVCKYDRTTRALGRADHALIAVAWLLPGLSFFLVFRPAMGQPGAVLLPIFLILIVYRASLHRAADATTSVAVQESSG